MNQDDPHSAPKSDVLEKQIAGWASFTLVSLRWSKERSGFSLHAEPRTHSLSGQIQVTDFLQQIGFRRSLCGFVDQRECYALSVGENFDFKSFLGVFTESFDAIQEAEKSLERCGLSLPHPEGPGYFYGKPSSRSLPSAISYGNGGDGHTNNGPVKEMKKSEAKEDANFRFFFTWRDGSYKGWTIHYASKHGRFSEEVESAFKFLGLRKFTECPQIDFDPCWWRFIPHESRGDSFFDNNANAAHGHFDSHAEHFSSGIEKLLGAQALIEKTGMGFLEIPNPQIRLERDLNDQVKRPTYPSTKRQQKFEYDVAISFAGTEREAAKELAKKVLDAGFVVFFDEFYDVDLWGKDLPIIFHEIYSKRSRYCVIFVSDEYNKRMWTNHERRAAQERMLKENKGEYILPVKIGDAELPGMPSTVGYISLDKGIDKIGDTLIKKLAKAGTK